MAWKGIALATLILGTAAMSASLKATAGDPYRGWAEAIVGPSHNKTCFDQGTQEYTACEEGGPRSMGFVGGSYIKPKFHRIEARVEGSDTLAGDCVWTWSASGSPPRSDPAQPCAAWHQLDIHYPAGATVTVRAAGASAPSG